MTAKVKIRSFLHTAALFTVMVVLLSANAPAVQAADDAANKPATNIFYLANPSAYGDIPAPDANASAESKFASLVWGGVMSLRYIIGAISIAFLVYSGFRMVTGWGNDETYSQQRANLFYSAIGLAIVGLAGEISNIFAVSCPPPVAGQPNVDCVPGGFLKDPNAIVRTSTLFEQRTQIIITFIKYMAGSVAVLEIIISGMRMITMGSNEEKMEQDKKNLIFGVLGLILIIIADTAINKVLYTIDKTRYPGVGGAEPAINFQQGVAEVIGFTNFIVSIIGPLAIAALLGGGILYMVSRDNQENVDKAKRIVTAALVGLIIIYGAFAIVNTFIAGYFPNPQT